ncbi:hypothetical protein LLB_3114 [Legionella longbeachae D-4968]|nr:hypothetical protein LLB_3114 [Legionella longbeachae D-4968]
MHVYNGHAGIWRKIIQQGIGTIAKHHIGNSLKKIALKFLY